MDSPAAVEGAAEEGEDRDWTLFQRKRVQQKRQG